MRLRLATVLLLSAAPALTAASLAVAALAAPALADEPASRVAVTNGWARATAGGSTTSAAYVTLTDTGAPDRLMAASTSIAARAEVHETINDQGVMRMRPVQAVALPPNVPVTLAPGGMHVMLMGLTRRLSPGDHFALTLTFEHAAPVTVEIVVGAVGGMAPMQH